MYFSDRQKIQQLEGHLDRLQQWATHQDAKNEKEKLLVRELEVLIEQRQYEIEESCRLISQAKSQSTSSETSKENRQILTYAENIL